VAKLLLISGSLRGGSTNSATLRTAAALAPAGVEAEIYDGMGLLPHFNPDDDPTDGVGLAAEVTVLRAALADADALLLSTPEYAGALPGSFKNLLDWTVGGGEMDGKPAAWLNVAAPGRGAGAVATLASVLSYVGAAVVDAACRDIPVARAAVTPDGAVSDPAFAAVVAEVWAALLPYLTGTGVTGATGADRPGQGGGAA
jgi:NAD(P)H-dependent FMN reductase